MSEIGLIPNEEIRYSRHLNIPEIGTSGQIALKKASVLVVGAGGLGSAVSLYLAAAGIGGIGIVDSDSVVLSNLQRQILHSMDSLGVPKVVSAKNRLNKLNPLVKIETYHERATSKNIGEIINHHAVVIDATDNFETRFVLNNNCVRLKKPFVFGAVYHFYGQMSVFDARKGPCFRCVFGKSAAEEDSSRSYGDGVLSPVPGVIGALQAIEAIKLIVDIGQPAIGKLLLFDGLQSQFQEILIKKNAACPVCGSQ